MLRNVLLVSALVAASAFAPGSVLPTSTRAVGSAGPVMQVNPRQGTGRQGSLANRQGSAQPAKAAAPPQRQGSLFNRQASAQPAKDAAPAQRQGSRIGSMFNRQGSAAPAKAAAPPVRQGSMFGRAPAKAPAPTKVAAPVRAAVSSGGRFQVSEDEANVWDIEGADWAVNGGVFGKIGDVTWAREAEIKHGRICMLAALGSIVQDVYTFPFMDKWYKGEKMWGLHEAAIKSGAMWQVLFFVGLLEIPFLLKLANGSIDGSGDLGFDPLGLKESDDFAVNQLREVKNGRLAMIAIGGMTHHYFLTGKGPIEFITQIPNFKSCAAAAVTTGLCK